MARRRGRRARAGDRARHHAAQLGDGGSQAGLLNRTILLGNEASRCSSASSCSAFWKARQAGVAVSRQSRLHAKARHRRDLDEKRLFPLRPALNLVSSSFERSAPLESTSTKHWDSASHRCETATASNATRPGSTTRCWDQATEVPAPADPAGARGARCRRCGRGGPRVRRSRRPYRGRPCAPPSSKIPTEIPSTSPRPSRRRSKC